MAVKNLANIAGHLVAVGKNKNTPVTIVESIGSPGEKIIRGDLSDIDKKAKRENIFAPAIVIIGKVAGLGKRFDRLRRKKILFTGLSEERYFIKGKYFHLPLIKIEPLDDYREFDNYLKKIKHFDWIAFASRYGVEYFFKRMRKLNLDVRTLRDVKIAAVGSSTAKSLLDFGIVADLVPKDESSRGMIKVFTRMDIRDKSIFLPRSDISDKGLRKGFEKIGAKVKESYAYKNIMPKDLPKIDLNFFDEIMFTSPSTVRNFKKRYKKLPKTIKVKCIGHVTLKEAKRCRLSV